MDKLDRVFTPSEIILMEPFYRKLLMKYTFRDNIGNYILCWDLGRFLNHSFHANCMTTAYNFELTIKDIEPGEKLTNDYGTLNIEFPFYCLPEKRTKRKVVLPDDLVRYHKQWDRNLQRAFHYFQKVDQPLGHLLDHEIFKKACAISNRQSQMDSILSCYYLNSSNTEDISIRNLENVKMKKIDFVMSITAQNDRQRGKERDKEWERERRRRNREREIYRRKRRNKVKYTYDEDEEK